MSSSTTSKQAGAPSPPLAGLAALQDALKATQDTNSVHDEIQKNLNALKEKYAAIGDAITPRPELASEQLSSLRHKLAEQDQNQEARVNDIKRMIRTEIKVQVAKELDDQIHAEIKSEVAKQVKAELALQIGTYLPVPLTTQVEESRRQIVAVKRALENSEARRANSVLRPSLSNLTDVLAVVFRPDGTKSALYPANLRSLFAYDNIKVKTLLKDFDLHDYGVLEKNLNRFMAHIGIRFELVPVPPSPSPNAATSTRPEAQLVPLSA